MQNRTMVFRWIRDIGQQIRRQASKPVTKRGESRRRCCDEGRCGGYNEAFIMSHWANYNSRH